MIGKYPVPKLIICFGSWCKYHWQQSLFVFLHSNSLNSKLRLLQSTSLHDEGNVPCFTSHFPRAPAVTDETAPSTTVPFGNTGSTEHQFDGFNNHLE